MSKTILVDCDGVLLNWLDPFLEDRSINFRQFEDYGKHSAGHLDELIETFNNSARIGYLPSIPGAIKGIARLKDAGYEIHCVTSCGVSVYANRLRFDNIRRHFENAITYIHILPLGSNKYDFLKANYENSEYFFVEDNVDNCHVAVDLGIQPILLTQHYNASTPLTEDILRASDWNAVCDIVSAK